MPAFKGPRGIIRDKSKLMKSSDFERNHHEKSTREDFVRTCANLRRLTKTIHEKIDNERIGFLFQGMSEVLYYTDSKFLTLSCFKIFLVRNESRKFQLTAAMKFKGANKNAQIFFPSLGTPVKK